MICINITLVTDPETGGWFFLANKGAQLQILFNIILGKIDLYNTGLRHNI